ncbi:hypothetical protein D3C75_1158280 [compost metagenome]
MCIINRFPQHIVERMQSRSPHEWRNKTTEEIRKSAYEFIHTQEELRKQSTLSILPTIEINTDLKDWDAYAREIMNLLQ